MPFETSLVKVTGWVDPAFAEVVKAEAAKQKRSVSYVINEALSDWLARIENADKETGR